MLTRDITEPIVRMVDQHGRDVPDNLVVLDIPIGCLTEPTLKKLTSLCRWRPSRDHPGWNRVLLLDYDQLDDELRLLNCWQHVRDVLDIRKVETIDPP